MTFLAESVELIDPLLCPPLEAALPRVPRETGHRDECSELRRNDGDGRRVGPQVVFHRGSGARHFSLTLIFWGGAPSCVFATVDANLTRRWRRK